MTIWSPDLGKRTGPRYIAIADALAADIAAGRLPPGTRLPTHRDLADRLGVTVGTVSRAYSEADRRGLVRGEVGRGTFVRPSLDGGLHAMRADEQPGAPIDLSLNLPVGDLDDRQIGSTLAALAGRRGLSGLLEYQPHAGAPRHRAAGVAWLERSGLSVPQERVLVCSGAQHAMAIVLGCLAGPGDLVLAEQLTYPGIKSLAAMLHLDLRPVEIDDDGIRPDALEKACRAATPKVLYCNPTIQNPTASVMSAARRRRVAAIALRHDMAILEDDIYGLLAPERPRPLSAFAPGHGFYVSSLSKTVAPGLRIAYVAAPERHAERLALAIRSTTWMAAPLMAEIAATWIEDGTADASLSRKREEIARRQLLATAILPRRGARTHPYSFHVWLRLPEGWSSDGFVTRAWQRGVIVSPAATFAVGGGAPEAVRLCLGAPRSRAQLERGLRILAETLSGSKDPDLSIV